MPKPGYTVRYLFFMVLQAIGLTGMAQNQHIRFGHIGTESGLSQSNVMCIFQDSRGFMWFGTREGLNKYDGYTFTVYKNDPDHANSLSINSIQDLVEDARGNIWIGTWGGGLDEFIRDKEIFIHFKHDKNDPNSISSDFINGRSMLMDSKGTLWIGTTSGLNVFNEKKHQFIHYTNDKNNPKSLSGDDVTDIVEDGRHNIWVSTETGGIDLFNKKEGTFSSFLHDPGDSQSLSNNTVREMIIDSKGRLWAGTYGGGMELLDRSTGKFHHFKNNPLNNNSLNNNSIITLREGPDGEIWIGTENGGVNIFNPVSGQFTHYVQDDIDNGSLNDNSIYSLYKDKKGDMWVGTFSGGINFVSRDANKFALFRHNTSPTSLSNNKVLNIFEDASDHLWIGTDGGGLNLLDRNTGKFSHFMHEQGNPKSICGNYVLKIIEDKNKNLWIGTWGNGITVFNPKKNTYAHFKNNPDDPFSLSNNNCWSIYRDNQDNIWIGTKGGGLNAYDPRSNRFTHYKFDVHNPSGISNNWINCIFEDSKNCFWIGTDGGGLNLFDKKKGLFTHFEHDGKPNSLSHNSVRCIFEDSRGDLWLGTNAGLNRLDRKTNTFITYLITNGQTNNAILGILEDAHGNFWISTDNGLSRFNPQTKSIKNFTVADGLQSNEFRAAYCKTRNGEMYFGGILGLNAFFPEKINDEISFDPPLIMTGFQIFNQEAPITDSLRGNSPLTRHINETKEIRLSYRQSVISFDFASLNYTVSGKKKYTYMLEGFDNKWNNIGIRHTATYTNLDPGKYVFSVRGLKNDGSWSPAITHLLLTITPPFWKTWWFRLLVGMGIIGGGITFYKIRMNAIKAQKKELERQVEVLDKAVAQGKFEIASDVLHDIGNAIVGFGSYLTRIKRLLDQDKQENLEKLAGFFEAQQPVMVTAIGEAKAGAVIKMLSSTAQTQKANQEEMSKSITEQLNIITHIQEILHIQRQYITGKETQERKPVNFRNIINDSLAMLFSSIDKSAIAVSLEIPDELPFIKGDRTKLMQLVLTILKNSVEAIDVQAPEKTISIGASRKEDQLTIEIRDSGSGFDEAIAHRFFERGFTTKFSGAGLGLYNCRAILESHEGTIAITSEGPGKGAIAIIKFTI